MAAIGRFQKDGEIFHAKVVDGELFRLRGDVLARPRSTASRRPEGRQDTGAGRAVQNHRRRPQLCRPCARNGQAAAERAACSGSRPPPRCCPMVGRLKFPFRIIARITRRNWPSSSAAKSATSRPRRRPATFSATRPRRTSATARFRKPRANGRAANRSTPSRRWGHSWKRSWTRTDLTIQLFQNGHLRQNSNTNQIIFKPAELVSFISTNLTLLPGDVILTGTPSGIGPIQSGDKLEVRIQGLAPLVNR